MRRLKTKRILWTIAILLVGIAGFLFLHSFVQPHIIVKGNLSRKDLNEIQAIFLRNQRASIVAAIRRYGRVSSAKHSLFYIKYYLHADIERIEVVTETNVLIFGHGWQGYPPPRLPMSKGTNGWKADWVPDL